MRKEGRRLNYAQVSPRGAKAYGGVYAYLMECDLPVELVVLIFLRVSQLNKSAWWINTHWQDLEKLGMATDKIALVDTWVRHHPMFSEVERAALAWTEAIIGAPAMGVSDEAHAAAHTLFHERELVDITIATTLMDAYNHISIVFGTPSAVGMC